MGLDSLKVYEEIFLAVSNIFPSIMQVILSLQVKPVPIEIVSSSQVMFPYKAHYLILLIIKGLL